MAGRGHATVTVEEYLEGRAESAGGRVVWRRYRRSRWEPAGAAPSTTRQVLETAGPLLRAVAIAMAPVVGRLAVRALAPRLRAALPGGRRVRVLSSRPAAPLSLPAPGRSCEDGGP